MFLSTKFTKYWVLALSVALSAKVSAAVIDIADSGGKGYFADTVSGLVWQDVDNFWGLSEVQVRANLVNSGFRLATLGEVQALVASAGTPLSLSAYDQLARIIGGAVTADNHAPFNRNITWGFLENNTPSEYWVWLDGGGSWNFMDQGYPDTIFYSDLGAWVVQDGAASVTETFTTAAVVGAAFAGLFSLRRKFARA